MTAVPGEGMESEGPVADALRSIWRVESAISLGHILLWLGAAIYLGPTIEMLVFVVGVGLVSYSPVLEFAGTTDLVTEKSPAAVRDEFTAGRNPLTVALFDRADAVRESDDPDVDLLLVKEYPTKSPDSTPVTARETEDGSVRVQIRESMTATITPVQGESNTRVEMTVRRESLSLLALVKVLWTDRYYVRILSHFGYQRTRSRSSVELSL